MSKLADITASCDVAGCRRMVKIGQTCCPYHASHRIGSKANRRGRGAKALTDEQVAEVRRMWSRFVPINEIASHFGVDRKTVRRHLKQSRSAS